MPTPSHFLQVSLGSCQTLIFNWVGRIFFLVLCDPLSPVSCSSTSLPWTVSFMKGLLENAPFIQLHIVLMAGQRMDPVCKVSYLSQGKSLFILLLPSKPQPWPPVVPTMCHPTNQIMQMKSSQNFSFLETCPHHSPASGRDHMEVSPGVPSAFPPSPGTVPFSLSPKSFLTPYGIRIFSFPFTHSLILCHVIHHGLCFTWKNTNKYKCKTKTVLQSE